eukprot:4424545-Prymnesium_polylepis.2
MPSLCGRPRDANRLSCSRTGRDSVQMRGHSAKGRRRAGRRSGRRERALRGGAFAQSAKNAPKGPAHLEEEQLRRSAGRTRWLQHAVPLLPRPSEEHLERPPAARPYSEAAGHQISRAGGHDVLLLRHRLHHVVALPDCVQ